MQIVWHVMKVCHHIITIIYFLASTPNICCTMSRDMLLPPCLMQSKPFQSKIGLEPKPISKLQQVLGKQLVEAFVDDYLLPV